MTKTNSGEERRRAKRRPILDSFSLFVSVPKKGPHRLKVHDVSDLGLGFDLDAEGESLTDFLIQNGEMLEVHFYLNQSLYLPLRAEVTRIVTKADVRQVGAEFVDKASSKAYKAYLAFLVMLDSLAEIGKVE